MRRMDWLDNKKDEILDLYENQGKKQIEIAKHFNTSQTAISTRLRKWGRSNTDFNRFKRFDNIEKEDVRRMYWDEEMHPVQIAEKYGCNKQVIVNRMKEWGIQLRTKSQARRGKLNPIYGVGHTKKARKKMSDAFVNGRSFGFGAKTWGKGQYYDSPLQGKVWMRSSWEVKVADYLTNLNLDWYYENDWLKVGDFNYLPDFYIPMLELYIEVKGRKKKEDMKKLGDARKKYNIALWDREVLFDLGIINSAGH